MFRLAMFSGLLPFCDGRYGRSGKNEESVGWWQASCVHRINLILRQNKPKSVESAFFFLSLGTVGRQNTAGGFSELESDANDIILCM